MATHQELADAVELVSLRNQIEYGFDSTVARNRATEAWSRLGGQDRLDQLLSDPQIYEYIVRESATSGGFLGGLMSGVATFANEAGIKEGLLLGGLAYGAYSSGWFGTTSGASATFSLSPTSFLQSSTGLWETTTAAEVAAAGGGWADTVESVLGAVSTIFKLNSGAPAQQAGREVVPVSVEQVSAGQGESAGLLAIAAGALLAVSFL